MKFTEMIDSQWNQIEQHLPKPAATGRPRADDRTTINVILFVLITGCRWLTCQANMAPNHQLTEDSKNCNKKEYGKGFSNV